MSTDDNEIVDLTMDEEFEDAREVSDSQLAIAAVSVATTSGVKATDDVDQDVPAQVVEVGEEVEADVEHQAEAKADAESEQVDECEGTAEDDGELPIIPSLEEQRRVVSDLLSNPSTPIIEGTVLYVIRAVWFNDFMNKDFNDAADAQSTLRSIDTHDILKEGDLFGDQSILPLRALTLEVFDKLVTWYGLAPGSAPVTTFAIIGESGEIEPEYIKPHFYLHHLISDPATSNHHHSSSYTSVPLFSVSRLHSCGALVQQAIHVLDRKEHISRQQGFENKRFRVWVIRDNHENNLDYLINTSTFMNLEGRYLIKKMYLERTIKDIDLKYAHVCIEEKVTVPAPSATTTISNAHTRRNVPSSLKHMKTESYWPSMYLAQFPPTPSDGRIGLQNLGNTCYMNSALQCLVHIPELTQYFLFKCYQSELNPDNPLGNQGKVALSFANLIQNLFEKKSSRSSSYTPRDFKNTIGYFNEMFSGYQQQDSQEFLAFLLDCLHEDLNRITKKPITTTPELNDHQDAQDFNKVSQLAEKSWEQHKLRNDSIITDLFVGMYKSTLVCPVCDKISITFDPFNDLTLPLPVDEVWQKSIVLFLEDGPLKIFDVELNKTSTYAALKKYIADKLGLNQEHLFTSEIWNNQFYKNFESSESESGYLPLSALMAEGDAIVMYEVRHSEGDLIVPVLNTITPPSNIPDAFGVPFFITVTQDERKSFGAIRKKLENRFEQLSTFKYFSKVRSAREDKRSTIKDFPLLPQSIDDESDYDSDISLANPEISGDYAFTIKVFDSSREVKNRSRRTRHGRGTMSSGRSTATEEDEKIWMPSTQNNFTNLPNLLDSLGDKKKAFYTYAHRLDTDSSTESGDVSTPSSANDKELMDIIHNGIVDLESSGEIPPPPPEGSCRLSDDDGDESPEMDIEPLTSSLTFPSNNDLGTEIPSELNHAAHSPIEGLNIVGPHVALVCDWDLELFDTFFVGLEGDGEDGKETWSIPERIPNEEVEEARRLREEKKNETLTLDQCLNLFSKPEVLSEQDLWWCSNCKEHRAATKQIQIWNTPDILTIHLKRFQNQRSFSDKIDAVVDFPIEGLDMSPHLASSVEHEDGAIYDLFAVDNHYGGIGGGHYTSYAKNFVDNQWYYYNDSHVSSTDPQKAINGAAYLLFYKRRSSEFLGGDTLSTMLDAARNEYEENERIVLDSNARFYGEHIDESDSDDSSDEIDGLEEESFSDEEYELEEEPAVKHIAAPMVTSELDDDSSDNISIAVGVEDSNDGPAQRRKQRLISRGKSYSDKPVLLSDVDIDSPATMGPGSPVSVNSEDNYSTFSSTVNITDRLQ